MALTDESNGMVMPVSPMYGGGNSGGFGGDWSSWIILFLIFGMFGGGWGNGFGGGFGGGLGYDFPWLLNGQNGINANTNSGFDHLATQNMLGGIQNAVTSGFGDVQTALCGGFAGVNASINGAQNALAAQMYANQIADMERSFAAQTAQAQGMNALQSQFADCCCENRLGVADLKYTVATENCADRTQSLQNTRDIIDAQTRGTQAILDKLCALELDGVKSQLAAAQRENIGLQNQVNMANMQASQTAQTAQILAGQAAEIDGVYNRLKNCPVGTYPVCNPLSSPYQGCSCGA